MGSRRRLHGGRLYAGTKEGESEGGRAKDGSPHPRGQREGCGDGEGVNVREGGPRGTPLREIGWGARMGSRRRLHGGGLYAGMTEGGKAKVEGRKMGPRIREDNGRGAGFGLGVEDVVGEDSAA